MSLIASLAGYNSNSLPISDGLVKFNVSRETSLSGYGPGERVILDSNFNEIKIPKLGLLLINFLKKIMNY